MEYVQKSKYYLHRSSLARLTSMKIKTNRKVYVDRNIAAISPLGVTWDVTWDKIKKGERCFRDINSMFENWPKGPRVGLVVDWTQDNILPEYSERFHQLLRFCVSELLNSSSLPLKNKEGLRCMAYLATSHGDPAGISYLSEHGIIGPDLTSKVIYDDLSRLNVGLQMPVFQVHGACASGIIAAISARTAIQAGLIDIAVILSIDIISRVAFVGFNNVGAMSKEGCAPFDENRDGITVSEGAVGMILAAEECVETTSDVQVCGGSYNCSGGGMVEPDEVGLRKVIESAFNDASISPSECDFVYWHGTGTLLNDAVEASVAKQIWLDAIPLSISVKGALGHAMGASGAFNIAAACKSLYEGVLPPVTGLNATAFDWMPLPKQSVEGEFKCGLAVAMGFGGINAAIVLSKQ